MTDRTPSVLVNDILESAGAIRDHVVDIESAAYDLHARPITRPGYNAPVGAFTERGDIWPPGWVDATGHLRYYAYGWHTGADLNLNSPHWDADRHRPVVTIGEGEVYAVRTGVTGWGSVICIRHADCLSRYAHCENIQVRQGERVTEVESWLGNIGNAGGRYPYHLHFDVARPDSRMAQFPLDWPGQDKSRVERDYLDPAKFLRGG